MPTMELVKSDKFNGNICDFYCDDAQNEYYLTREQIGRALEYSPDPTNAVSVIHRRHKDRIDKFSRVVKLTTPGGTQESIVYSRKGAMEICRWSRQPKANDFMDWVWDVIDNLIRSKINGDVQNQLNTMNGKIDSLSQILPVLTDKSNKYDEWLNSNGLLSLNETAKLLDIGQVTMDNILRENKIFMKRSRVPLPYRTYQKNGFFHVKTGIGKHGFVFSTTFVTPKGVELIHNTLTEQ